MMIPTARSARKRDPFPSLPADAIPNYSGRQVYVFPNGDRRWTIFEVKNSDTGSQFEREHKAERIAQALVYVYAELVIRNNLYGEFWSLDLAEMFQDWGYLR